MRDSSSLFVQDNGTIRRFIPGMTIQISLSILPSGLEGLPSEVISCHIYKRGRGMFTLDGCVIAIWSVGSTGRPARSGISASCSSVTSEEKALISALCTSESLSNHEEQVVNECAVPVLPGGICSFFV